MSDTIASTHCCEFFFNDCVSFYSQQQQQYQQQRKRRKFSFLFHVVPLYPHAHDVILKRLFMFHERFFISKQKKVYKKFRQPVSVGYPTSVKA